MKDAVSRAAAAEAPNTVVYAGAEDVLNTVVCTGAGEVPETTIRAAVPEDLDAMLGLIAMAVAYMKQQGIRQWSDGYPNAEVLMADICRGESYVCEAGGRIIGTAALSLREETTYRRIFDGGWLTEGAYGVIHRIAVDDRAKGCGVAAAFVDYIEKMCISHGIYAVRVDTHEDNLSMQRMLKKHGFVRCGIIYLASGDARVAFEKVLGEI